MKKHDEHTEEDVIFEASTEEGGALSGGAKIKKLQERIKELEKEKTEYLELLKTPVAEEDAKKVVESLHEDLILKTLESDPIFG